MRGRFITFEGGEGSGKSTAVAALAERLKARGTSVVVTREPGGSPGAEILRHVILSGAAAPLGPDVETILFAAARDDHMQVTIKPALDAGRWVICDRFFDSTRAYQGTLGKVDANFIRGLERVTVGTNVPDLTIILDVPADVGLARAAKRRGAGHADRFESENAAFHQRLRDAFLAIAENEPNRCVIIDGTQTPDAVNEQVWRAVEQRLLRESGTIAEPAA